MLRQTLKIATPKTWFGETPVTIVARLLLANLRMNDVADQATSRDLVFLTLSSRTCHHHYTTLALVAFLVHDYLMKDFQQILAASRLALVIISKK
jgi:hypothetical protein